MSAFKGQRQNVVLATSFFSLHIVDSKRNVSLKNKNSRFILSVFFKVEIQTHTCWQSSSDAGESHQTIPFSHFFLNSRAVEIREKPFSHTCCTFPVRMGARLRTPPALTLTRTTFLWGQDSLARADIELAHVALRSPLRHRPAVGGKVTSVD